MDCNFQIFPGFVSLSIASELDRPVFDVCCCEKEKRVMMDIDSGMYRRPETQLLLTV